MSQHKTLEFWFDVGSPYTYLAWKALPALLERTGAKLDLRPMLLGGIFKATGNRSPAEVAAKGAWTGRDLKRWASRLASPFERNPHFPVNTLVMMRGAAGLRERDPQALPRYLDAVFEGMWVKQLNMGDPQVLAGVLSDAGFDPKAFIAMVEDPFVKESLKHDTEAAVARGVFGSPTFFVDGELYFGQDRLDFVEQALRTA
jgi:2-hydroxychromene-2-carboxylate isomerase